MIPWSAGTLTSRDVTLSVGGNCRAGWAWQRGQGPWFGFERNGRRPKLPKYQCTHTLNTWVFVHDMFGIVWLCFWITLVHANACLEYNSCRATLPWNIDRTWHSSSETHDALGLEPNCSKPILETYRLRVPPGIKNSHAPLTIAHPVGELGRGQQRSTTLNCPDFHWCSTNCSTNQVFYTRSPHNEVSLFRQSWIVTKQLIVSNSHSLRVCSRMGLAPMSTVLSHCRMRFSATVDNLV